MTAWPAEQLAAHDGVGILAVVLLPAVEAALVGAVLGNLAGYAVGRRWKGRVPAPLQAGAGRRRYTERALGLIERRGAGAVFVGRFTAVLLTLVPTLCGRPGCPCGAICCGPWSAARCGPRRSC
ncbi:VTT domain-containing protein [Streptomyces sp. Root369]|uniref:DedA family protein n=1 Tax=Streptomyces sp. Root369 TaxID=1736523 RepID=UPI00070E12E5|nr:VTT domain-containing protein [Streptomyces sp. Root369]KQW16331.1 hypothetical protein ASD08_25245 [Streptomyces sp. Root369]